MESLTFVSPELRALGEEYDKKETKDLPIIAMVTMALYNERTSADNSLRKLAGILAYVLVIEAVKNRRNCDLTATLGHFSTFVKEMFGEINETMPPSTTKH